MREVTQEQFYAGLDNLDCHPEIVGRYPYTSIFRMQDGTRREVGRITPVNPDVTWPVEYKYYLVD